MTMYSEEAERLVPPPLCPVRCDIDRSARRQTFSSVQSYREIMNVKEAAAGEIDLLDPPVHRCCVTHNRDRSGGSIDNLFNVSDKTFFFVCHFTVSFQLRPVTASSVLLSRHVSPEVLIYFVLFLFVVQISGEDPVSTEIKFHSHGMHIH